VDFDKQPGSGRKPPRDHTGTSHRRGGYPGNSALCRRTCPRWSAVAVNGSRLMQLKIDENLHADAADPLSQHRSIKRTEMEDVSCQP
jgi:hypothetical protein